MLLFPAFLSGCVQRPPQAYTFNKALSETSSAYVKAMENRILQSVPVEIDEVLFVFLTAPDPIEPTITLRIFNHKSLVVDITSIDQTASGQTNYAGIIRGEPLSTVFITREDSKFTMDIQAEEGCFQVIHNGSYHELVQLDLPGVPKASGSANHAAPILAPDQSVVYPIDLLLLVSTDASASAGGIDTMLTLINLAVHETNLGFLQSNVNAHVAVAQIVETGGEPDSYSDALYCLVERNDDCLEAVHGIRDDVYADLVLYIMDNNESCGASWVNTTFNEYTENTAFGTLNWRCIAGYYGFAKEIGHLMGAQTDRENANFREGVFDYSYGYQAPDGSFRTIMALDCDTSCPRINYWSNPAILYNGQPTGIASGDSAAHNQRTLNEIAPIVSDYRVPPSPPDQATLLSPYHNEAIVEQNPTFTWYMLYDATEFNLELRRLSDGLVVDSAIVTATQACDPVLCSHSFGINYPPDDYTWRVAGINSIGQGEWSDMNTFNIRHPVLTKISPTANARVFSPTPTLKWMASELATRYQIRLVDSSDITIFDVIVDADDLCDEEYCTYRSSIPLENDDYRWYVRAFLSYPGLFGSASTFSKVTLEPPATFAPENQSEFYNNDIEFRWKHVNLADSYNLEITNQATQEITNFTLDTNQVCPTNQCSFTLPYGFTPATYEWRLNAQFRSYPGFWTNPAIFSIIQLPPMALIEPMDQALFVDLRPTFQWEVIDHPDLQNYQIHIRDIPTNAIVYSHYVTPDSCNEGVCTHSLPTSLISGQYKWHVRGKTNTLFGKWSVYWEFNQEYTPETPTLVAPENEAVLYASRPTLIWNSAELAESYQLQFVQDGETVIGDWQVDTDVCSESQCEYLIPLILTQYDTYQWQVRAIRGEVVGNWSETFSFAYTQLEMPTQFSPADFADLETDQPEFSWSAVTGAEYYPLQIRQSDGTMIHNTLVSADEFCDASVCRYLYPDTLQNGAYSWHVRGKIERNFSHWSPYWDFEIVSDPTVEFDFNGTAEGWVDISERWSFFNQVYYRGTPGNAVYLSAITYYDAAFEDAKFESHMRSVGTNAKDGFSLILRSQFAETGELLQGYTIDIFGTDTGIDISGWRISSVNAEEDSEGNFSETADLTGIDITIFHVYRLEVIDATAYLYIDNELAYTLALDPAYTSGAFGFDVISTHQSGHSVDVNWVRITPIE